MKELLLIDLRFVFRLMELEPVDEFYDVDLINDFIRDHCSIIKRFYAEPSVEHDLKLFHEIFSRESSPFDLNAARLMTYLLYTVLPTLARLLINEGIEKIISETLKVKGVYLCQGN